MKDLLRTDACKIESGPVASGDEEALSPGLTPYFGWKSAMQERVAISIHIFELHLRQR